MIKKGILRKILLLTTIFLLFVFAPMAIFSQNTSEELKRQRKNFEKEKEDFQKQKAKFEKEKLEWEKKKSISDEKEIQETPSQKISQHSDESFFKLEENIVITATKRKQKISNVPAPVYVITAKQIRERGYRTLVDALADVPGFDFQHNYGIYPELIHQRGLVGNNQRSLVYVDGIPDNNLTESAFLGGTIRFPLQNVERIEIVAGPSSALYGANAFNGIINLITKDGKSTPGHHVETFGGFWKDESKNPGAGFSFSSRGKGLELLDFHYSVAGYYFKTAGPYFGNVQILDKKNYSPNDVNYYLEKKACSGTCTPDQNSIGAYWSNGYNDSRSESYNFSGKFSYGNFRFESINWQYLQGRGTFSNGTQRIDTSQRGLETNKYDFRNNARRIGILNGIASPQGFTGGAWDFRNNSVTAGYLHKFSSNLSLDSELLSRHTEVLSSSHEEVPKQFGPAAYYYPGYVTRNFNNARPDQSYELKERIEYQPFKNFQVTTGIDLQNTSVPQGYGSDRRIRYNIYGSYVQAVYTPIERVSVTAGLRYDKSTIWGDYKTPRLSLVMNPIQNLYLKFLYGHGFRAPTAWEMFNATPTRKTNPGLTPERMRTFEAGFGYRLNRLYMSITQYYNSISNLILEVSTNEPNPNTAGTNWTQNQNVGQAFIQGTEVSLDYQILNNLNLFISYTHNKGEYKNLKGSLTNSPSTKGRPGDDYFLDAFNLATNSKFVPSNGQIPNIAPNKMAVGFTFYLLEKLSIYMGLNYVDVRRTIATNPEKTVPGYKFLKLNIRWEDFLKEGVYIQFEVLNLGNQQFFDPGIRTATGTFQPTMHPLETRNVWFTLGYKF
ncbi:MAG: TonB-dependent receptor [Leptospiraceae bacterium]|nr:TonB-dependent receptor [Leptospiraceae bacterium]